MDNRELFISGYAKLPQGITATELYTIIALGLVVDYCTGEVLDVDCSLVTQVAREFVKKSVKGKNLNRIEDIEEVLGQTYYGSARKALISALRTCAEKYKQIKANVEVTE